MRLLYFVRKCVGLYSLTHSVYTMYLHNHDNQNDGYIISTF